MTRPSTFITAPEQTKAVLVGVLVHGDDEALFHDDIEELSGLLAALDVAVVGKIVQRRAKPTAQCLIGTGKVDEIRDQAVALGATLIVFDQELSPPQVRNIEQMTGLRVMDRAGIILEIFAKQARTAQAKMQIEMARLTYLLPRLTGAWTHLGRQGGGGTLRGKGETQIEIDRRRARERLTRLKRELEHVSQERATQRKGRLGEFRVALVGYTNTGKTTLMNALTRAQLQSKDALFVTLDANVRAIDPTTRPRILLTDTVGFIRKLPHSLVASFKSTLAEVADADLLLHVVDVSHPNYKLHMTATMEVLEEIGAGHIPTLVVFNKLDRCEDKLLPKILGRAYPGSLTMSAENVTDLSRLRDLVYDYFSGLFVTVKLRVPHTDQNALSTIHQNCVIVSSQYEAEDAVEFVVQGARGVMEKLKPYWSDADSLLEQNNGQNDGISHFSIKRAPVKRPASHRPFPAR